MLHDYFDGYRYFQGHLLVVSCICILDEIVDGLDGAALMCISIAERKVFGLEKV